MTKHAVIIDRRVSEIPPGRVRAIQSSPPWTLGQLAVNSLVPCVPCSKRARQDIPPPQAVFIVLLVKARKIRQALQIIPEAAETASHKKELEMLSAYDSRGEQSRLPGIRIPDITSAVVGSD